MIIMDPPHLEGYEWGSKIGGGSFSSVYKAFLKSPEKTGIAVKCIHRRGRKMCTDAAVKEITLMKRLRHDNIIKLIDFQFDAKYIYIIMEYCNEGDLSKLLKEKYKLSESFVQILMQQLGLALKYLRQYNICHMDLKPQNILLTKNPTLVLKLGDFGLSQILSEENVEQSRFAGSISYMAPEKLLNQKFDSRVDLWSVGIILYECLVGRPPFGHQTLKVTLETMNQHRPIQVPSSVNISTCCEDVLTRLLKYDPNERIGFEDFFNHEFLNLNYLICSENYNRVINKLVEEASLLEQQNVYAEALDRYNQAICIMEGFAVCETAQDKKLHIYRKLGEYQNRSKQLKKYLECPNVKLNKSVSMISENQFQLLVDFCKGTPALKTGLDIGYLGEMYLKDGKQQISLEMFTSALAVLLPLLRNEPDGERKDMLHKQIQKWLCLAESLKV